MFTGILYTHIFYALGGSEMPNGQNLRPIAACISSIFAMRAYLSTLVCTVWQFHAVEGPLARTFEAKPIKALGITV